MSLGLSTDSFERIPSTKLTLSIAEKIPPRKFLGTFFTNGKYIDRSLGSGGGCIARMLATDSANRRYINDRVEVPPIAFFIRSRYSVTAFSGSLLYNSI